MTKNDITFKFVVASMAILIWSSLSAQQRLSEEGTEWIQLQNREDPHIVVTPGSFSQMLEMGGTATQILNIANTGEASLDFVIEIDAPARISKIYNHNRLSRSTVYYNQTGNPSAESGAMSQDPIDKPEVLSHAADDFLVPEGETWTVNHIYVAGKSYSGCYVIIDPVDIVFYSDSLGLPGDTVFSYNLVHPHSDFFGNLNIFLPAPAILTEGHYWVSVVAHTPYYTSVFWYWTKEAAPTILNEFAWERPNATSGCTSWCPASVQWPTKVDFNLTFALTDSVYVPSNQWLSAEIVSGTVPAGGNLNVELTFDAGNIQYDSTYAPYGSYSADIRVTSNDPGSPVVTVPAALTVIDPKPLPLIEDWETGLFHTHGWTVDPIHVNWNSNSSQGNPGLTARFLNSSSVVNYNQSIVTPYLDAREIQDNVTLEYDIFLDNANTATLENITVEVDNGTGWQTVDNNTNSEGSFQYRSKSINITDVAAGNLFKVRFRANGYNSASVHWWYVDNVKIYQQVVGNISGIISRLSDGGPVEGADITLMNLTSRTHNTLTASDGTFTLMGVEVGLYTLVIQKEGYNTITDEVTVSYGLTTSGDYVMTAPTISVDPLSLDITLNINQIVSDTITVYNNGNGPLAWNGGTYTGKKQIQLPASDGTYPRGTDTSSYGLAPGVASGRTTAKNSSLRGSTGYAFDLTNSTFVSFSTDDPSSQSVISSVSVVAHCGTFDAFNPGFMYIIDDNDCHLKKVDIISGNITDIGKCDPHNNMYSWTGITVDKMTNRMYAVCTNGPQSYLALIDMNTAVATDIGPMNVPLVIDIAIDGTGQMYGYDIAYDQAYQVDKETGTCYILGSLGFDANYAQGSSWNPEDDNIYLAAFNNAEQRGELRILDRITGNTILVGVLGGEFDALGFAGLRNYEWVSIEPASGLIPANGSQQVVITFDGSYIPPQQKDLTVTGELEFHSDPNVGQQTMALSMTIEGEFFGILKGNVTHGFGGTPVDSVMITATREGGDVEYVYSMLTDSDGSYHFDPVIYGTYTITAERKGFNLYTFSGVLVEGGQTTIHDIGMVSPTMHVSPNELVVTAPFGEIVTRSVEILNSGDGTLTWEADFARNTRQQVSVPASNGKFPRGNNPASYKRNPDFHPKSIPGSAYANLRGSLGYGFDIWNYAFFSFNTDDPATQNFIYSMEYTPFGGTFDEIHTDFMYIVDYNDITLKTVDIATGEAVTVGPMELLSDPTGLTCDKTDGTLYASSTNGSESLLYKVDPRTGQSTLIGPTGIPILIDITIDGEGQMYGYDISGDNAYKIDKRTGASELLGSIGFDANYAQGMCWDPGTDLIFLAAYSDESGNGELRVLDKITGNTEYLGDLNTEVDALAFPGGGSAWLSLSPRSGVIPPGEVQEIIATLDGNYIPSKDYTLTRDITFISHPEVGNSILPVTFTITADIYGVFTGTISHAGQPVGGATVEAHKYGSHYSVVSQPDGSFIFNEILEGTYDVIVEDESFCSFQTTDVVIIPGQTTTLEIVLQAPVMQIDPSSLSITIPKNSMKDRTIVLSNSGDCALEWNSQLVFADKSFTLSPTFNASPMVEKYPSAAESSNLTIVAGVQVRDQWDVLFTFNCNYAAQLGIETDGQYIYTSSWLPGYGSWFHKYAPDGTWIEDFNIEGVTGIRDLAYDGQYFYGGDKGPQIYQMDFTSKELIKTISTVIPQINHIAYDPQADAFWTGGWDHLYLVNRSGDVITTAPYGLMGMAGSAYDPWSPGGPYLWLFNQTIGGSHAELYQFSIPDNALTSLSHNASDVPGYISGANAGGLCISDEIVPGKIALIGNIQQSPNLVFAYDLVEPPVPGITRTPSSGVIYPGSDQTVTVHFDATGLEEGIYTANLIFTSIPDVGTWTVPITLTVVSDTPLLSVTPASQEVSYDMGTANFYVNNLAGGDMNYTAAVTMGNEWLTITQGESGLNSGMIEVTFTENTELLPRSGTVTVNAPGANGSPVDVTVLQSAAPGPPPGLAILDVNVQELGSFTVPVSAENISNMGYFQFTIDYDASVITYKNVSNWISGLENTVVNNPEDGHITFIWSADPNGIDIPAGILFDLNFDWSSSESFTTEIMWSDQPVAREFRYADGTSFLPEYVNGEARRSDGIADPDASSVQLFPNPAGNQIFITFPDGMSRIRIVSSLGQLVHMEKVSQAKTLSIETSHFTAGNYYFFFDTDDGHTMMKKIVIIK